MTTTNTWRARTPGRARRLRPLVAHSLLGRHERQCPPAPRDHHARQRPPPWRARPLSPPHPRRRRRPPASARARPIDILVDYTLKPIGAGCALDALISIHPRTSRLGRLLARATGLLLATGTLDHAMTRIAHEAELKANPSTPPAGATDPRHPRRHAQTRPRT